MARWAPRYVGTPIELCFPSAHCEAAALWKWVCNKILTYEEAIELVSIAPSERRFIEEWFDSALGERVFSFRSEVLIELTKMEAVRVSKIEQAKNDPFVRVAKNLISCGVAECSVEARQAAQQFLESRAFLEKVVEAEAAKRDGK
jgi:hypothetical protein